MARFSRHGGADGEPCLIEFPGGIGCYVYNEFAGTITPGTVLTLSSWDATGRVWKATKADAGDPILPGQAVALESIAQGSTGKAGIVAEVDGLDTSAASVVGAIVFASATAGECALVAPSGADEYAQRIGRVTVKGTVGRVRFDFMSAFLTAIGTSMLQSGSVTGAKLATNAKMHTQIVAIEDLAAGADVAARAEFVAPVCGCTLSKIGYVPLGDSAGIDDADTVVIAIADGAGNSIVSKTFNTANQPAASGVYASLGALSAEHKVLTANETVTVAVTQGTTANLPALRIVFEWLAPDA